MFCDLQMNYVVCKKECFAKVESVRNSRRLLQAHNVTIVTEHRPLLGFMKSLHTNPMLIRWQESLGQLDISIKYLESKKNIIADMLSMIDHAIKIPTPRDSTSSPDSRHSYTEQLPVTTNHLMFPTPYLRIPLTINTSSAATMPSQTNNRISAGNRIRRYEEDEPEYW